MKFYFRQTIAVTLLLVFSVMCLAGYVSFAEENAEAVQANSTDGTAAIALTINGDEYSVAQCNMYFIQAYNDFLTYYGSYAPYLGLDTSLGINSLAEQTCGYNSSTWYDYFLEFTLSRLCQYKAMCDYADEVGIVLSDESIENINSAMAELEETAKAEGYDSTDACLEYYYGEGVTAELFREYLEVQLLAESAYYNYIDNLELSDEAIAEHYLELGYSADENQYNVTSMRHILVMAEADENGSYTEEAIATAHAQAEDIYAQWLSGDKTEDSFAEMATALSDDTGSISTGGLYEDIYQGYMVSGINDWLFNEPHEVGDVAIIDNNGSYTGTHVVYFAGYGDLYSTLIARDSLRETTIENWFNGLVNSYECLECPAYSQIGIF